MKSFFAPNIGKAGRLVRGVMGLALIVCAAIYFGESPWLGALLGAAGLFGLLEALRGWCLARACGMSSVTC